MTSPELPRIAVASPKTPLGAIRAKCLDCCRTSLKGVRYCPATDCGLWPHRFGVRPATAAKRYGADLLRPDRIADHLIPAEELP